MLSLYWKHADQMRSLIDEPFDSEAELERYIFENQDLLGDVFVLHRQIRTGSKEGILDMLGVDQDARICIIELKNCEADEDILPQALGYAIWAETNPDSIKAIWLESDEKPEDVEIDWDSFDIRVILIAPSFKDTVARMADKIGYPIDLMEVRRYRFQEEEFLAVELLEKPEKPSVGTTKARRDWDWAYYESQHGEETTEHFRRAVEDLVNLVAEREWPLQHNLNKRYVGFKLGNRLVFRIRWDSPNTWTMRIKGSPGTGEEIEASGWEFRRYHENAKEAVFSPRDVEESQVEELEPLLVQAYKFVSGSN